MSNVILKGYITVLDSDLVLVKKHLVEHVELTNQENGCLMFEVLQDKININQFSVYEEFVDKCAFEMHQLRVSKSEWGAVTKNVERHYVISGNG